LPEQLTLGDLLRKIASEVPDRKALVLLKDPKTGEQPSWTYSQLLAASEATAHQLLQKFKPGEHVMLWSSNRPEWFFVQFGAALAGLVLVAVNPSSRAQELSYILQQSDSVGVIYSRYKGDTDCTALLDSIRDECPGLRETIAFEDWPTIGRPLAAQTSLPKVDPRQAVMIQYTSGTTGKPKGALLSHYSLVNATKTIETSFELNHGSVWLHTIPLYNTSGCVFTTLTAIWNRGTQVLLPYFDPELVFRGVEEEHANWMPLVPTMAVAVLDHPTRLARDFSSVKVVVAGGAPVAPELVKRIERDLGVDFLMVFGQTEGSGAVCLTHRKDTVEHRTTTIGYPLGGIELRICDPENNRTLQFEEAGEICIRGPAVMLGYYNMPEATARTIDAEGWLHSGDLGLLSKDGYPKITGRLKDLIIRGGSNIYPRELEDVLNAHAAIAESSVFGIPEAKYGEVVVAAIRLKADAQLDQADVTAFLQERLARFKLPAHVWFVNQFPLTPSGKIQKFVLREQFLAAHPMHDPLQG
jgi:fatty-acyl-CoA synthase